MKRLVRRNVRATVRYRCAPDTSGKLIVQDDHVLLRAWILDLSYTGAGLLLHKPIDPGQAVTIRLRGQNTKKAYDLAAHVAHSTQQSGEDWLVGCEFVESLTIEQLDDLL